MSELITAILAFDIVVDPKAYAYEYLHDQGVYIGCKAQGRFHDGKEYEMHKVDCINCEYAERRAYEDTES